MSAATPGRWWPHNTEAISRRWLRRVRPHAVSQLHWRLRPSRKAIASCSTRTASMTGTTGRASNTNAGNIEQNLCTANGSSQSNIIYPPQSPTRITNNSILKLAGAFHCVKTSRIRFWAFSYSMGEPCGRSDQVSMYFIGTYMVGLMRTEMQLLKWPNETQDQRPRELRVTA